VRPVTLLLYPATVAARRQFYAAAALVFVYNSLQQGTEIISHPKDYSVKPLSILTVAFQVEVGQPVT